MSEPFLLFVDPQDDKKVERIPLSSFNGDLLREFISQFEKGGRAMVFLHFPLEVTMKNGNAYSEPASYPIELQFVPQSKADAFYRQRRGYGETRLMGRKIDE
jgi:hypothetical protein